MRLALLVLFLAFSLRAQTTCAPSAELQELFEADQADREADVGSIDWAVVAPRDEKRRMRVAEILKQVANPCPELLYQAAMVFQHGDEARHYLLAHVLSTAAAVRGHEPSRWLSAASLDRYLQHVGQPQIFGANNTKQSNGPWTQEPFDRSIVSPAIRVLFKVDSLEEQQRKLDELNAPAPR